MHSNHAAPAVAAGGAAKTYSTPLGFWSGTNVPSTPVQKNRHETQAARSHHMSALSFVGWKRQVRMNRTIPIRPADRRLHGIDRVDHRTFRGTSRQKGPDGIPRYCLIVQFAAGAESARPGKALLAIHIKRVQPADGLTYIVRRLLRPRRGQTGL